MNGKLEPEQFEAMLAKMPDAQLVDVRTPEEFAKGHLKGAKNMDYQSNEFEMDVQVLDKNKPVFVYCLSGGRSSSAAEYLREKDYKEVYQLKGGIMKWKAAKKPVEGDAGEDKPASMSMDEYNSKIKSDKLVLVDFSATWCGPCQKLAPTLEELGKDYSSKMDLLKIDADDNRQLCSEMKVDGLPTMFLYKNGVKVWMKIGYTEKSVIEEAIKKNL